MNDDIGDDLNEDYEDDAEVYTCNCRYCFCMNDVQIYGDTCNDCLNDAHQG